MSVDFMDALDSLNQFIPEEKKLEKIEHLPTGIINLDELLGGGIPRGKITEIYGTPDSGKSAISYNLLRNTVQMGGYGVLIDTEDRYSPEWWSNWELRAEKELITKLDPSLSELLPTKEIKKIVDLSEIKQAISNLGYFIDDSYFCKKTKQGNYLLSNNTHIDNFYTLVVDDEFLRVFRNPNIRYYYASIIEDVLKAIDSLIEWGHKSLDNKLLTIVLDSYDGVPSKAETEAEIENIFKGKIAAKPSVFGACVSRWMGNLSGYKNNTGKNSNVSIIILNHAKQDFQNHNAYYSTGGTRFKHLQYTRILLRSTKKVDPAKTHAGGFHVTARVERNKAAPIPDGLTTEFRFMYSDPTIGVKAHFEDVNTDNVKSTKKRIPGGYTVDMNNNNETGSDVGEEE